ncbi:TPR repeat containing protein [Beggiatoa sp. PS]|nr:TPR repeat containing protein [Beggiatoa sp. PS]
MILKKIDEQDVERLFGQSTFQLFTMTFEQVNLLPSSYDKAFALIGLAKAMRDFKEKAKQKSSCKTISPSSTKKYNSRGALYLPSDVLECIWNNQPKLKLDGAQKNELSQLSFDALTQAIKIAQKIQNVRAISYAKGYLAQLYEEQQRYSEAIQLTRQAIFLAQQNRNHPELLYRWEGQLGRLFEKQEEFQKAIDAYERAIFWIDNYNIRQELQAGYRIYQTSREVMSPIYLGLADLLLKRAEQENGEEQQKSLKAARNHLESFKDLELRDYFQDECVIKLKEKREAYEDNKLPKNTALLYPVLLEDRIELLLSLRTGIRQFIVSEINSDTLETTTKQFHTDILGKKKTEGVIENAHNLYQWLIQPIVDTLKSHQIKNLVIIPDGILRTIPFTALHDGKQYLVESYAITIMPKLQIPNQMPLHEIKVLLGGFSKEPQHPDFQERGYGFSALENVAIELEGLKAMLDVPAINRLQNDDFTFSQLKKKVKTEEFNIIHFATHGHFGGESNETFLVAHDGKMTMNELRNLVSPTKFRETPIELLTLSACQTAVGDEQAALGLAGIALSSGARSALASLWKVSDPSTAELMKYFYQNLINNQSKAYALQNAQRQLLQHPENPKYVHPYYWAAFLLIEN